MDGLRSQQSNSEDDKILEKLTGNSKIIVKILSSKIEDMKTLFQATLEERDRENAKLRTDLSKLKTDYARLADRVEDLETSERKYDLVISGKSVPVVTESEDCKTITKSILDNLRLNFPDENIRHAYRLGTRPNSQRPDRRNILVKMSSPEFVQDVIKAAKTVKPKDVFMNENLTPKKHKILQLLRKAKKDHPAKISGCGSRFGRISVWTKPQDAGRSDVRLNVNNVDQLSQFCTRILQVSLESFLGTEMEFFQ